MTVDPLVLAHGEARALVAPLGAEARAWSVGGVELLWPGDPAIWNQISPILYPVVGWTRDGARVGGKFYALGLHGFAASNSQAVVSPNCHRFVETDPGRLIVRDGGRRI